MNYLGYSISVRRNVEVLLALYTRLNGVFSRCGKVAKDRNTRDHLGWTIGNGDPVHGVCIPHKIPRHGNKRGKQTKEQ